MTKRKKKYRWGEDPLADMGHATILAAKGLGRLREAVQARAAKRVIPENLQPLVAAIEAFTPARPYRRESQYQTELLGWLKGRLGGSVLMEVQRGRSRPDIVVDTAIALELKGPTTNQGLQTVSDKIVRYRQYFPVLMVVLFDVQDERYFSEWAAGMKRQFPEILIIKK